MADQLKDRLFGVFVSNGAATTAACKSRHRNASEGGCPSSTTPRIATHAVDAFMPVVRPQGWHLSHA
jgi:hypothetical protein